jgi:hypothetical protein
MVLPSIVESILSMERQEVIVKLESAAFKGATGLEPATSCDGSTQHWLEVNLQESQQLKSSSGMWTASV